MEMPLPPSDVHLPVNRQVDVYGTSHPGCVRPHNEDNYLLCSLHKTMHVHATSLEGAHRLHSERDRLGFLAVVADGLGGLDRGEEASRVAIETIAGYAGHCMDCFYRADPTREAEFLAQLQEAARRCHQKVVERSESHRDGTRMATTMTLLLTSGVRMYVVQVGDSRCYLLHRGKLLRITRDQTLAQQLVDEGTLTEEEAERSRFAHVLSSAIGADALHPVTSVFTFTPRDVILLCSDGLTRHVSDEEIRETLESLHSAEQATKALVDLALERGGEDNVTVLIGCLKRS